MRLDEQSPGSDTEALQAWSATAIEVSSAWADGESRHWPRPAVRGANGQAPFETELGNHMMQGEDPASLRVSRCVSRDVRALAALLEVADGEDRRDDTAEAAISVRGDSSIRGKLHDTNSAGIEHLLDRIAGGTHSADDVNQARACLVCEVEGNVTPAVQAGMAHTGTEAQGDDMHPASSKEYDPKTLPEQGPGLTTVPMIRCS